MFFIIHWLYGTYEMNIFGELADNEVLGCSRVVGADSRKWGRFGGVSCVAQCASGWPVGLVQKLGQVFVTTRGWSLQIFFGKPRRGPIQKQLRLTGITGIGCLSSHPSARIAKALKSATSPTFMSKRLVKRFGLAGKPRNLLFCQYTVVDTDIINRARELSPGSIVANTSFHIEVGGRMPWIRVTI